MDKRNTGYDVAQNAQGEISERLNSVSRGDKLAEAYQELGKAYYEGGFEDPLPELLPLFDRITSLRQSAEKPNTITCPQCGRAVRNGSQFCGWCGIKLYR